MKCASCRIGNWHGARECAYCGAPLEARLPVIVADTGPPERKRGVVSQGLSILGVLVGVVILVALFAPSSPSPSAGRSTAPSPAEARYRVTIERESYEHGYLKLIGTVENTGSGPGYSPRLDIRIYRGSTLLAEDTAWPAGMLLKHVSRGQRAAFESITRVPDLSGSISYQVSMTAQHTIDYPKRR